MIHAVIITGLGQRVRVAVSGLVDVLTDELVFGFVVFIQKRLRPKKSLCNYAEADAIE